MDVRAPSRPSAVLQTCAVCSAELSPMLDGLNTRVCRRAECRWTFCTTPKHRACRVCSRPLSPSMVALAVCDNPECRREHTALLRTEHDEIVRARRKKLAAEALALRDATAEVAQIAEPERYRPTPMPRLNRPLTRLPRERRDALAAHIGKTIDEAVAAIKANDSDDIPLNLVPADDPIRVMPSEHARVLSKGCELCRGECCTNAGNMAYLRIETITRYLVAHPEKSRSDVIGDYLVHVGSETFDGSCLYHGNTGCTLPRELRSNICNTYYCLGLTELRRAMQDGAPARAFMFSSDGRGAVSAAFVSADEVRVVQGAAATL